MGPWISIELDRDKFLRRTLALELAKLEELEEGFTGKAMGGDVAAGTLMVKIYERRATLLGMNARQGHAVQIIEHEPAAAQTSTEKIRAAIDRIRGKSLPKPESGDPDKLN